MIPVLLHITVTQTKYVRSCMCSRSSCYYNYTFGYLILKKLSMKFLIISYEITSHTCTYKKEEIANLLL